MKVQTIVEAALREIGKIARGDRHPVDVEFDLEVAVRRFAERRRVRLRLGAEEARERRSAKACGGEEWNAPFERGRHPARAYRLRQENAPRADRRHRKPARPRADLAGQVP